MLKDLPPHLQKLVDQILENKNDNANRLIEVLQKDAPCLPIGLATEIAHKMADLYLLNKLLSTAFKRQSTDPQIAEMYISFAIGIAQSNNARVHEGDAVLNNLFSKPESENNEL